jgi:hypothetical protein
MLEFVLLKDNEVNKLIDPLEGDVTQCRDDAIERANEWVDNNNCKVVCQFSWDPVSLKVEILDLASANFSKGDKFYYHAMKKYDGSLYTWGNHSYDSAIYELATHLNEHISSSRERTCDRGDYITTICFDPEDPRVIYVEDMFSDAECMVEYENNNHRLYCEYMDCVL